MGRAGSTIAPVLLFHNYSSFVCLHFYSFLITMDLQKLAETSVEFHRQLKTLELQLKAANATLLDAMIAENVSTIKVERRTVSLVTRRDKDFGEDIKHQELLLKAEKKRLEVMGQFTIASTSQSIRIN